MQSWVMNSFSNSWRVLSFFICLLSFDPCKALIALFQEHLRHWEKNTMKQFKRNQTPILPFNRQTIKKRLSDASVIRKSFSSRSTFSMPPCLQLRPLATLRPNLPFFLSFCARCSPAAVAVIIIMIRPLPLAGYDTRVQHPAPVCKTASHNSSGRGRRLWQNCRVLCPLTPWRCRHTARAADSRSPGSPSYSNWRGNNRVFAQQPPVIQCCGQGCVKLRAHCGEVGLSQGIRVRSPCPPEPKQQVVTGGW